MPFILLCCTLFIFSPQAAHASVVNDAAMHDEVIYQVFPESFADSNGDGIGDIRGIIGKVGYLHDLGVDVLWLNPVYRNTHYDSGYDVSDYLDIDPQFGTLADLYALRDALHAKGMRLMMDAVLNHTSDQHAWFIQEKRLKILQTTLTHIVGHASPSVAEQVVNLLGDPTSEIDPNATYLLAAKQAVDAFLSQDDNAAVRSGYPDKVSSIHALSRELATCADHAHECPGIEMPFDDFYIWRDHPNNWTGIFSGSAWHKVPSVDGYFMALFSEHQIDLNWRNPTMRRAMAQMIATWEARGIDGMRLDSIGTLSKDPTFPTAPPTLLGSTGRGIQFFTHLPPVHAYMRELAKVYDAHFRTVGEVAFTKQHPHAPIDYAGSARGEMNEVFVFEQMGVDCSPNKWRTKPFLVTELKKVLAEQQALVHGKAWLGNYFENHDQMRIVSRYGNDGIYRIPSAKAFAALLMTLQGTPYVFQGQELGMTNLPESTFKDVDDVHDIEARNYYHAQVKAGEKPQHVLHQIATRCRDHVRTAIQWRDQPGAGFTTGATKIRINDNYRTINAQQEENDPDSVWNAYRKLIAMRRTHSSWLDGTYTDILPDDPNVLAYTRTASTESTLVLINLGNLPRTIDVPTDILMLAHDLMPQFSSYNDSQELQGRVTLRPWETRIYTGPALHAKLSRSEHE